MKNNKTTEMWENAFEKINEKYITEAAEIAPSGKERELHAAPAEKSTGNLKFVLAAAAAVIVSFIGVGFFFNGTGIEPLSPSADGIGTSGAEESDVPAADTSITTTVAHENGRITTVTSISDGAVTTTLSPEGLYSILKEEQENRPVEELRPLTLADVITLSKKGERLTWSDFEPFEGNDVGSGLYIMQYGINDEYCVMVGGVREETPRYIRLFRNQGEDNEEYIDIRTDDVIDFLSRPSAADNGYYTVKDKVLYISSEVEEIPGYMFSRATDFTQVSIPASVKKIGDYAFANSTVENVVFEDTAVISDYAFADCVNLNNVVFFGDVDYIGDYAFKSCNLGYIALPDSFTNLGQHAFLGNNNITIWYCGKSYDVNSLYNLEAAVAENAARYVVSEYQITDSVLRFSEGTTKIDAYAFAGMENFREVIIPEGVTEIGEYAFVDTNIKKITLPRSLTRIGDYAFYRSTLEEINIPAGVKEIGYSTFDNCLNLEKVTLNSGLEKIGERAFMMCSMLSDIEIPDTVTEIGGEAFMGTGLYSVTIPASVISLGSGAFANCIMLEEAVFEGSMKDIPEFCFSSCTSLRSVKLPNDLRAIYAGAFSYCTSLDMVLPDTVKTIADNAFEGCTQFDGTFKPTAFDPETENFTLIRPVDSTFITTQYSEGEGGHDGIDYAGTIGDKVYAAADGIVTTVETDYDDKGYGKYIIIDHGNGFTTCYCHLDSISVEMFAEVSAGDVIGGMGNTGWATGPHLHFVLAKNGAPVDPHIYLDDQIQLIHPTGDVYSDNDILFGYGEYEGHKGIDYSGEKGQDVVAAASGTVTFAEWNEGYGNCVIIDHRNGYQTLYGHLDEIKVKVGDTVTAGHLIGTMGSSGIVTGVHLHFELLKDNRNLDPADYIN